MNKRELVDAVAAETGQEPREVETALGALLAVIGATLAAGDPVALPGFGTFEVRTRAARTGRNPRTGEALAIAASAAPVFKPAAALKRRVADAR